MRTRSEGSIMRVPDASLYWYLGYRSSGVHVALSKNLKYLQGRERHWCHIVYGVLVCCSIRKDANEDKLYSRFEIIEAQ